MVSEMLKPFSEDWRILCMETDGELLWIGTNRGLFKYNHTRQSLKRYRYSNHRPGMLSQAYITGVKLTSKGDGIDRIGGKRGFSKIVILPHIRLQTIGSQ